MQSTNCRHFINVKQALFKFPEVVLAAPSPSFHQMALQKPTAHLRNVLLKQFCFLTLYYSAPNLNIDSERSELNILQGTAALHKGRRSAK